MKTILCYGDSNTWGYDASSAGRYPLEARWTTALARELGPGYYVVAEGLNGRTTVWPDPVEGEYKSGKSTLIACLESHHPVDLVVLMLGTNDLKHRFGLSAWDIASGAGTLVQMIRGSAFGPDGAAPEVLLIAPAATCVGEGPFKEMFAGADGTSKELARHYRAVALENGCAFLDAGSVIVSDPLDGIHLSASELPKLGGAVATKAREILE
jgi:lysophospholipase L1-like esterase